MLIEHILRRKGSDVATVAAQDPVTRAVSVLGEHNIGALVVAGDGGAIVGILSERDIVRALAAEGPAALERTVGDLMTTEVTTCGLTATADDLMSTMTERRIRHIPVVGDGGLVGIVSIGDVVKSRIGELESDRDQLESYIARG